LDASQGRLHVVLGAGAIGLAVAEALVKRGEAVRVVNRGGRAEVPDGVEVLAADVADADAARRAAAGAAVVFQCLNPPYDKWPELFPALQAGAMAAAEAAQAKLVVMENLYLYGRPGGRSLTEDSPRHADTRKGKLRGRMSAELFAAHRAGRVRVAVGRASDYFGPRGGAQSMLGDRVVPAALAGRPARVLGDPDQPHTYSYIPDIGEGLVVLGEGDEALGHAWHLPNPETRTTRQLVEAIFRLAGHQPRVRAAPALLLRLLGLFNPVVRELNEMAYEFEEPFVVDSSRFEATFGVRATPLDQALETTVDWYRQRAPVR
jgi:nucleoside-diphosphate-sugar epimerase